MLFSRRQMLPCPLNVSHDGSTIVTGKDIPKYNQSVISIGHPFTMYLPNCTIKTLCIFPANVFRFNNPIKTTNYHFYFPKMPRSPTSV
jgi:hypothetical protein